MTLSYETAKADELRELTRMWFDIVTVDHHKDRDCHFYINQVFSYGHTPTWRIEHYGYIWDFPEELQKRTFDTYEEALNALVEALHTEVRDMLLSYKKIDTSYDFNVDGAKKVYEIYKDWLALNRKEI